MADKAFTQAFNSDVANVRELKTFLRDRGEQVSGNKPELVRRAKGVLDLGLKPLKVIQQTDKENAGHREVTKFKTPLGEILPDPSRLPNWLDSLNDVPNFTDKDLYNYLVLNCQRTFDHDYLKANRAFKAKVFYEECHVHSVKYHKISEKCSHCFVKCKVIPSYPTKNEKEKPDYDVWLSLSKISGHVHSAGCSCSAGEGESCNHIAALLYALVDISRSQIDGMHASTSMKCKWNEPRKRRLSPNRVEDIVFKKHKFSDVAGEGNARNIQLHTSGSTCTSATNVTPVNLEHFSRKLQSCNKHAAWLYGNAFSIPVIEPKIPPLHNIDFLYKNSINLASEQCQATFSQYFHNLKISGSDCASIEQQTRQQAKSSKWQQARVGRITTSNFGLVCKTKQTTSPENLIGTLFGYNGDVNTASVRWGQSHEAAALRVYTKKLNRKHCDLEVTKCGLNVNPKYPHLGSSPDGLVSCSCHDKGLVEIKCPFKYRFKTPAEASMEKDFYCHFVNGKITLKENHSYHYQIQGQMAVCQRNFCDFFVWTLRGDFLQRIDFDIKFWENCLNKINSFYLKAVIPELFSERVKRGLKLY
ncbi:uncharacterized protein LOC121389299 [Gigantopelta aegis]|uniref:uncharacterized protein LOC121389299 n=1 Tax=Gigantopelta aegis TaxID=1735272 RepID=UPI001B88C5BB|nr:uncharacterized protein LOC121389299 [Gigantopelta aegis]